VAHAVYSTTTEVYPDSKSSPVSAEQFNRAQVAAIVGGLEYIVSVTAAGTAGTGAGAAL